MYKFLMKALVVTVGVVLASMVTEQIKDRARSE